MPCTNCRDSTRLDFDFTMAFQPIIDAGDLRVWGYEALVRGTNGEGAAEVLQQVDDDNRYRFDQDCRVKAIQLAADLFPNDNTKLSINFMPNAVYEPAACLRATLTAADRFNFPKSSIMFEFTENERVNDPEHLRSIITEYRRHGFFTAIDDFGAGHAGLGLLVDFQPDLLKLDMHLLRDVDTHPARQAIVSAVVGLARQLDIVVLAEGVETEHEYVTLRRVGIKLFQGYWFARPQLEGIPTVNFDELHRVEAEVA